MKLIIVEVKNKIGLIKTFREEFPDKTLSETMGYAVNNFFLENLSKPEADFLKRRLQKYALVKMVDEFQDDYEHCNLNINFPPEYAIAMEWYNSLNDEHKAHVDIIATWRSRPAGVC